MRKVIVILSAVLVGCLYIAPPLVVQKHLNDRGQPFVLNYSVHRDELLYMARAREIYDGHWPPGDLHFDSQQPTVLNALPSLIMASFLFMFKGDANLSYFAAIFIFSAVIFLLLYWLGGQIFHSFSWSLFFAYVGILTPIAIRILNFDGA